jgi:hypothetical protein
MTERLPPNRLMCVGAFDSVCRNSRTIAVGRGGDHAAAERNLGAAPFRVRSMYSCAPVGLLKIAQHIL